MYFIHCFMNSWTQRAQFCSSLPPQYPVLGRHSTIESHKRLDEWRESLRAQPLLGCLSLHSRPLSQPIACLDAQLVQSISSTINQTVSPELPSPRKHTFLSLCVYSKYSTEDFNAVPTEILFSVGSPLLIQPPAFQWWSFWPASSHRSFREKSRL